MSLRAWAVREDGTLIDGVNRDPLRKVLGLAVIGYDESGFGQGERWRRLQLHEVLECGHARPIGPYGSGVKRRRCWQCRTKQPVLAEEMGAERR
jgi:hypothetical protein